MADTKYTFPVGRIVQGNLYKPTTEDMDGNPLVVKQGKDAGKPREDYWFKLAIPKKAGEQHFLQTEWGRVLYQIANQASPQAVATYMAGNLSAFSWKVQDGDSAIPNKKGTKACDCEGFPGHWVLRFSSGYAPKIYKHDGRQLVLFDELDAVKPGYWVEVYASIGPNNSDANPGLFLNHAMINFRGYDKEIQFGADPNAVGFGAGALPPGVSSTPLSSSVPGMPQAAPAMPGMPQAAPAMPGMPQAAPAMPGMPQVAPAMPGMPQAAPAMPGMRQAAPVMPGMRQVVPPTGTTTQSHSNVVPQPQFLNGPQTTAAAQGSYQSYKNMGWTDEMLRQHVWADEMLRQHGCTDEMLPQHDSVPQEHGLDG